MSSFYERVPFAEAISEPGLLAKPWRRLSRPQRLVLKVLYGLPLVDETDLMLWSAFQGAGVYDDLGYLQGVTHLVEYAPKEYDILTGILGRRSGKSTEVAAFAAAYEITLGGHTSQVKEGQDLFYLYVAQDLGTAQTNMRSIVLTLRDSPILAPEIAKEGIEEIKFRNGITLRAEPPNIKTARGIPVVGVTMDELGFWYKDAKSANPDKEVVTAIDAAMLQFPHAKQLRISTPWTKEGLLYEAWEAGTEGNKFKCNECASAGVCTHMGDDRGQFEGHVVFYAPTAAMEVPERLISRRQLEKKRKKDPEKFEREYMARFIDSQTSFLSHAAVNDAVDKNVTQRPFQENAIYIAAIDPAFRTDSFTFTVYHNDVELGLVQDYVDGWTPLPGERLNPAEVLDDIKPVLDAYEISMVYSDQYHLESLQQLALAREFTIFGVDLTTKSKSRVMQDFATMLNQKRVRLLDEPIQTLQLKQLQKHTGPQGYISISAPPGKHDDYATVTALAVSQALHFPGMLPEERTKSDPRSGEGAPETANEFRRLAMEQLQADWERSGFDEIYARQRDYLDYLRALTADDAPQEGRDGHTGKRSKAFVGRDGRTFINKKQVGPAPNGADPAIADWDDGNAD